MQKNTYAIDFETFYSKAVSIRILGPLGYFSHPDFDCYLLSVVGTDGYEFVGHPSEFNWAMLEGQDVVAHNASFDETLYKYGVGEGWFPNVNYSKFFCTADMASAIGLPRNLAGASEVALGVKPDKSTRANMINLRPETMSEEFMKEVKEYALVDSRLCLQLWEKHKDDWSDFEREVSRVNRESLQKGIPLDQNYLVKCIESVKKYLFDAEATIPWLGEKPTLSRPAFNEECRKVGITPPPSLAKSNPEAVKWIKENGNKYKWVKAVGEWRRINSQIKKLESLDRATMPNGRYYGNILYFGAHTGRFSGAGGNLNLQNLPKEEMFGANLRHLIRAKEGKKLIVADLSQIEVRTLMWWAQDKKMLAEIEKSEDIYETFAIAFELWDPKKGKLKKEDNDLRQIVKAIVLGCGFGAGPDAFSATYGYSREDSEGYIALYRDKMKSVTRLWHSLKEDMEGSKVLSVPFGIDLPSGRSLKYGVLRTTPQRNPISGRTRMATTAILMKKSKRTPVKIWHGLLTENISQALARDIMADMMLRIEKKGLDILFNVHDELIIEVDEDTAEKDLETVLNEMSTPPDWIPDIPVTAEGDIMDRYEK
ncbi:MAG: hypothetical protein CMA72_08990 [Euryarchaeota archaeon]|nr:hypothetical protein [Euryarchaeota archaeon]|tara:strand:+ start:536 stop:2320 length:1785 start_codon:yes stop_codon:yes gene_type:complete